MSQTGIDESVDHAKVAHQDEHRPCKPRATRKHDVRLTSSDRRRPQQDDHQRRGKERRGGAVQVPAGVTGHVVTTLEEHLLDNQRADESGRDWPPVPSDRTDAGLSCHGCGAYWCSPKAVPDPDPSRLRARRTPTDVVPRALSVNSPALSRSESVAGVSERAFAEGEDLRGGDGEDER